MCVGVSVWLVGVVSVWQAEAQHKLKNYLKNGKVFTVLFLITEKLRQQSSDHSSMHYNLTKFSI